MVNQYLFHNGDMVSVVDVPPQEHYTHHPSFGGGSSERESIIEHAPATIAGVSGELYVTEWLRSPQFGKEQTQKRYWLVAKS